MNNIRQNGWKRTFLIMAATAVFMWILLYAPTPFVIYEPGIAVPTEPMVSIEQSEGQAESDKGAFLLTTVKLSTTNFWQIMRSAWDSNISAYRKADILRGYSEQKYAERMSVIMASSQNNAIEAAYRYEGIPYRSVSQFVAVSEASMDNPGTSLQAGDTITHVEGAEVTSLEELAQALQGKQTGDSLAVTVRRADAVRDVKLKLGETIHPLTAEQLPEALGGVQLSELRSLEPNDHFLRLSIDAGAIGGPSAGLMFALQSIDLLNETNLTRGLVIAGTGTIDPQGEVGPIGGIAYKIVTAEEKGAELFLAPAANYEEAVRKARAIGSSMKVVGVESLEDAIHAIDNYNGQ